MNDWKADDLEAKDAWLTRHPPGNGRAQEREEEENGVGHDQDGTDGIEEAGVETRQEDVGESGEGVVIVVAVAVGIGIGDHDGRSKDIGAGCSRNRDGHYTQSW